MTHPTPNPQLLGFALYFFTYSTWEGKCVFMEDLYVQPDHRGKGIGTKVAFPSNSPTLPSLQLWKAVISAGLELECARCNWQVLTRSPTHPPSASTGTSRALSSTSGQALPISPRPRAGSASG